MKRIVGMLLVVVLVVGAPPVTYNPQVEHPTLYGMCRSPVGPEYSGLVAAYVWDLTTGKYACQFIPIGSP